MRPHLAGPAGPWAGGPHGGGLQGVFPLPDWWQAAEDDPDFRVYANVGIASAYALLCAVALVQLLRIHLRVPEYGWTTQKVFHLLNALVCAVRAGIFVFRGQLEGLHVGVLKLLLLDLPGLLFFTTYTLLVLFWAEIYHQARSMPTGSLRPLFIGLNVAVYVVQGGLWLMSCVAAEEARRQLGYVLSDVFLAAVSIAAAVGFILYGGRLFLMLRRFPIESRGRRKKLREVGLVTAICAGCFSVRALLVALSAFDREHLELDVLTHPLLNVLYYGLAELLPTACVLYILRKLPPKRPAAAAATAAGYQQIPAAAPQ